MRSLVVQLWWEIWLLSVGQGRWQGHTFELCWSELVQQPCCEIALQAASLNRLLSYPANSRLVEEWRCMFVVMHSEQFQFSLWIFEESWIFWIVLTVGCSHLFHWLLTGFALRIPLLFFPVIHSQGRRMVLVDQIVLLQWSLPWSYELVRIVWCILMMG